ncbi:CBS domain containing-hemolysin-like protein [Flavimobilis soli]|uniref:CBS domain containing-hemolysin-like protein n=1 Tax=Flavimobilis soli TaxID=442709 RepID=A0A2A9EF38_9MICO|nr:hemolysin family protein [Flavimobilis soli]PFG37657.1 CBS domain containing-hemolysin-like protein [Flavimobilis soli]
MLADWLMILLGVALTAGTAVFVASEFALVTLDPGVIEGDPDAADGEPAPQLDRRTRSVVRALHELSTELSSAQVGITMTTILLGYTAQPALTRIFEKVLENQAWATAAGSALAVTLTLVLVNVFSMLFGELIPKNFALSRPLETARLAVPLQRAFTKALRPVIVVLNGSANALLRRMGIEPREELSGARSAPELAALVRRSAEQGTLEASTARLLTNSLELESLTAVDVMTDRTRLAVVGRDESAAHVVALARRTGHSRFPVIGDSRDDIIGFVHLRRAVAVPRERRGDVPVVALMVEAPTVPETVRLGPLLVTLRGLGLQMAVVLDEYGGTSGVVTLEDVVEELVGEVADEHDTRRVGAARQTDGSWTLPGLLRPDELTEATGLSVPDSPAYETLGGLVMARLGRVPEVGDTVLVGDVLLTVVAMQGRRVDRLRLEQTNEASDGDDSTEVER